MLKVAWGSEGLDKVPEHTWRRCNEYSCWIPRASAIPWAAVPSAFERTAAIPVLKFPITPWRRLLILLPELIELLVKRVCRISCKKEPNTVLDNEFSIPSVKFWKAVEMSWPRSSPPVLKPSSRLVVIFWTTPRRKPPISFSAFEIPPSSPDIMSLIAPLKRSPVWCRACYWSRNCLIVCTHRRIRIPRHIPPVPSIGRIRRCCTRNLGPHIARSIFLLHNGRKLYESLPHVWSIQLSHCR